LIKRKPLKFFFDLISQIGCIGLVLLFSLNTQAKRLSLTEAAEKRKSIISGVLNPASLSINGQELQQSNNSYSGLLINGTEAKIKEVSGLKTFYEIIEGDSLDLKWKTESSTIDIVKIAYPAVEDMELVHDEFHIKFNSLTQKALYDGKPLDVNNARVEVPSANAWIDEPHTLELFDEKNISRLYNLDFRQYKTDLLTSTSWSLVVGDAPFSANVKPTAFGVGARILNERNYSHDFLFAAAKVNYFLGDPPSNNEATQETIELKYRWGYNPYMTNSGDVDLKRVTVGLFGALYHYNRTTTFPTSMDGFNGSTADTWFLKSGFSVRWEPTQFGNFGAGIQFDFSIYRSNRDISSDKDMKYFFLSYYFDPKILKKISTGQPIKIDF
jgi:hypothetical protein